MSKSAKGVTKKATKLMDSVKFLKDPDEHALKRIIKYEKGKIKLDVINRNKAVLKVKLGSYLEKGRVKVDSSNNLTFQSEYNSE